MKNQVINTVKREATDVMNLNGATSEFVAMATTAGIDIWHGSGVDLGLLDASYVHAAACAPTCTLGSDIVGHFIREHHLLRTPLRFADGHVHLPQEPGLGVELDMEALQRYTSHRWIIELES
ncbi:hypothetical protein KFU94_70725 [Chloroflexi bacterium TSY]|nr:hypothetical protein [Chloroflexi bacterium TSY]